MQQVYSKCLPNSHDCPTFPGTGADYSEQIHITLQHTGPCDVTVQASKLVYSPYSVTIFSQWSVNVSTQS